MTYDSVFLKISFEDKNNGNDKTEENNSYGEKFDVGADIVPGLIFYAIDPSHMGKDQKQRNKVCAHAGITGFTPFCNEQQGSTDKEQMSCNNRVP